MSIILYKASQEELFIPAFFFWALCVGEAEGPAAFGAISWEQQTNDTLFILALYPIPFHADISHSFASLSLINFFQTG